MSKKSDKPLSRVEHLEKTVEEMSGQLKAARVDAGNYSKDFVKKSAELEAAKKKLAESENIKADNDLLRTEIGKLSDQICQLQNALRGALDHNSRPWYKKLFNL